MLGKELASLLSGVALYLLLIHGQLYVLKGEAVKGKGGWLLYKELKLLLLSHNLLFSEEPLEVAVTRYAHHSVLMVIYHKANALPNEQAQLFFLGLNGLHILYFFFLHLVWN